MKKQIPFVIGALILAMGAPCLAAPDTAEQVVARHIKMAKAGDVAGVVADYADDTVVVTPAGMASPSGVYVGKDRARAFFQWLASPPILPAVASMEAVTHAAAPDVVIMDWTQFKGTAQQVVGRDVFVVRDGKIVFQSVNPKP